MEWSIQFNYDKNLDPVFVHKFFYFLISRSVKYNSKHKGRYHIIPKGIVKAVEGAEKEIKDSTEKLAEIVDAYVKFDLKNVSLGIFLDYAGEVDFYFRVFIGPIMDNKSFIAFTTNEYAIPDDKTFFTFMDLCKEAFVKFDFSYGAFRSQYEPTIPSDEEDFLKERPNNVNFYSKPLVDKIGREKLLTTPARKVEELENDGVMLIVCTEPLGCENIYDVWHHLGYK